MKEHAQSIAAEVNPWRDLPHEAPYVLPIDQEAISAFNRRASPLHVIHPEIVPEPYLGDPSAPVVLLNLNPGYVDEDLDVHIEPPFKAAARANLLHDGGEWPLYLLNPAFPSPGRNWWLRKLSALIAAVGNAKTVASRVFVAELHGYHSRRFHGRLRVPSQRYTFDLVRASIARGAILVMMRGRRVWMETLPELASANPVVLRNPQNPTISPGNCPEAFGGIVERVCDSHLPTSPVLSE